VRVPEQVLVALAVRYSEFPLEQVLAALRVETVQALEQDWAALVAPYSEIVQEHLQIANVEVMD
jgi:hypothetical protein